MKRRMVISISRDIGNISRDRGSKKMNCWPIFSPSSSSPPLLAESHSRRWYEHGLVGAHTALILISLHLYHAVLVGRLLAPHTPIVLQSGPVSTGSETTVMVGDEGGERVREGGEEGGRESEGGRRKIERECGRSG